MIGKAKYAYNDTTNRSTGKSPFKIVYGIDPIGVYELRDLKDGLKENGYDDDFAYAMQEIHEIVRKTMIENTMKHKEKVDESRKIVEFNIGGLVMVHINKSRLQKGVPHRLQMRTIGPFPIFAKYGDNAFRVELPEDSGLLVFLTLQT